MLPTTLMKKVLLLWSLLIFASASGQDSNPKTKFLSVKENEWPALFNHYKVEITEPLLESWRTESINLYSDGKFAEAEALINVSIFLADQIHQPGMKGKCLLVKSEINYYQRGYNASIVLAEQAAIALNQAGDKLQLSRSKHRIGLCYYALGDNKKAIAAFEEAVAIKKQLVLSDPENKTYAESLYGTYDKYGDALYSSGNYDKEIEINKTSIVLTKKWGWYVDEAYTNYCLGWTHYRAKKQYQNAIGYFNEAIRGYTQAKDTSFLLINYKEIITAREAISDMDGARADADKATPLAIAFSKKDESLEFVTFFIKRYKGDGAPEDAIHFFIMRERLFPASADSLIKYKTELAEYYNSREEYKEAITKYGEVMTLPMREDQKADLAWNRALVFGSLGQYQKEIDDFRESARYYSKQSNKYSEIVLLSNIAITYRNLEDSTNAYKAHDEAITVAFNNPDSTNLQHAFDKSIDTYKHFGSNSRRVALMKRSYEFFFKKNDFSRSGELAKLIGKDYEETLNDYVNADKYYQLSLESYLKTKETDKKGDIWWSIGYNAGENLKDYKKSVESYKKAISFYTVVRDTSSIKTLESNIGINYRVLEDSVNCYKAHDRAIAISMKNSKPDFLIYAYNKAQDSYDHFNDYKKRRAILLKKYELYKKHNNQASCGSVAQAIAKDYEKFPQDRVTANKYFAISIDHYKKSDDKSGLANAYWGNGYDLDVHQKKPKDAIESYKKSIGLFTELKDTSSLTSVLANVGIIYRELNDSVNSYKYHNLTMAAVQGYKNPEQVLYCMKTYAESGSHFKNYGKQKQWTIGQLEVQRKSGDPVKIGEALKAVGKVYEESYKDYATADAYYVKALEQFKKANNIDKIANIYWSQGYNKKENQLEYAEAIKIFELAYGYFMQNRDSSHASVMRSNVAQTYWSMEDFQKAIDNHKKAIDLATKAKNNEMIAKSWNALADLYKKTDNPVRSTEALGNAIIALETLQDTAQLTTAYTSIASSYSQSKEYAKSFVYYEKVVAIRKSKRDTTNWASALYDWAGAYQRKGEYKLAEEKYRLSMELHRKSKDKANEVYDLISIASIEQGVNYDYKKSEALYDQAVAMAKALNDDNVLAFCYSQMKYLYQSTGRTGLSEESSRKALEMYKKLKSWKAYTTTLASSAYDAYYVNGDMTKAALLYDQAQAIADTLADKGVMADILSGRASIYEERGDFTRALEYIEKSFTLFKAVDNEWGMAGSFIEKGNVYKSISEYEKAMEYQLKADSIYLKLGTEYARLAPLANLGGIYMAQGDYPKGLEYCRKAYDLMYKAGDQNTNLCIIKGSIGEAYYCMDNYVEAEKWLKEALETAKKVGTKRPMVEIYAELGRLKIEEKKYAEAEAFLKEGLQLGKELGVISGYLNNTVLTGKLYYEQKQYDKAKAPLDEAYARSKEIGKNSIMWEALYLLGVVEKSNGNLKQSKEYLKESVTVIEKIRNKVTGGAEAQKLFSSDKNILKVYDALVEVLLALGETEDAMTYLQKNNEDNLKAKFRSMDVKFESEEKNNVVLAEKAMKAKLDGIEDQIQKEKQLSSDKQNTEKLKNLEGVKTIAESEYLKFVNQQINVQPELSKYFNNSVQPTQFRKIKSKIPKDMALLSYLAGENQLYIFAATSDTVVAKIVSVPRAQLVKDINAMLNITRNGMGSFAPVDLKNEVAERKELVNTMKQTDAMMKPFEEAYHYLIAPVSKEIAGKKRLGVIPTGTLNYIPFQMLGKTLENGKFSLMMNQFAIFYANSTDMLFRPDTDNIKDYNILAFGNPDKSLPSTEREVNDIKRLFPNAAVFLREEATEDRAKYADEKYNVMHFATHGNLDYEDFSQSFLTMAGNPSKSEDGKLTLEELWGMDVMTHLNIVVLSACQTAVTKGSNESSAVSPASGFLQNGVKSVVATLWKVDDEATSLLISDFYKNLKTMEAVDALRSAQVTLASNKKFSHPYYWAAVVLLGDWR